jgi:outer membrane protein assembly factor BamB
MTSVCAGALNGCLVVIFEGFEGGGFSAYDQATGNPIWNTAFATSGIAVPATDSDSTIYTAYYSTTNTLQLLSVDSSGAMTDLPVNYFYGDTGFLDVVADDGIVFITGGISIAQVVAVAAPSRDVLWSYSTEQRYDVIFPLTVSHDTIYVSFVYSVTALDRMTGVVRWTLSSNLVTCAPAVGDDGILYIAQFQSSPVSQLNVIALSSATSEKIWEISSALSLEYTQSNTPAIAVGASGQLVISGTYPQIMVVLNGPTSSPSPSTAAAPLSSAALVVACIGGFIVASICAWFLRSYCTRCASRASAAGWDSGLKYESDNFDSSEADYASVADAAPTTFSAVGQQSERPSLRFSTNYARETREPAWS